MELDTTVADLADIHIWSELIPADPPQGKIGLAITNRIIKYRTIPTKIKPKWTFGMMMLMNNGGIGYIGYKGITIGGGYDINRSEPIITLGAQINF